MPFKHLLFMLGLLLGSIPLHAGCTALNSFSFSHTGGYSTVYRSPGDATNNIDTVENTIAVTISYASQIDLSALHYKSAQCEDDSSPYVLNAQGDTLAPLDPIALDQQGKASLRVVAADGSHRDYAFSITRLPASSSTALRVMTLRDSSYHGVIAHAHKDSTYFIDTLAGIIYLPLKYSHLMNLQDLRIAYAENTAKQIPPLKDAQGNALNEKKVLSLDSKGEATIRVYAENGNSQDYILKASRLKPSSSTAMHEADLYSLNGGALQPRIDTLAGTITATLSYSDPLDLNELRIGRCLYKDGFQITMLNAAKDTFSFGSLVPLDAQGRAVLTVLAEDSVTTQDYTLSITRNPVSKVADLSLLRLQDRNRNTVNLSSAQANPGLRIDNALGLITLALPYSSPFDTSYITYAFSSTTDSLEPLVASPNDAKLENYDPINFTDGKATLTVTAEDGKTTRTYTLQVTRKPASSLATLRKLALVESSGDTLIASLSQSENLIDTLQGIVTLRVPASREEATLRLAYAHATDYSPLAILSQDGKTVPTGSILLPDAQDTWSFSTQSEDGSATRSYQLRLLFADVEKVLAPAPQATDWRAALLARQGSASLTTPDGRTLWSASLPASPAAVQSQQARHPGMLMLRIGSRHWTLAPRLR